MTSCGRQPTPGWRSFSNGERIVNKHGERDCVGSGEKYVAT
jgi:hypothetical protein